MAQLGGVYVWAADEELKAGDAPMGMNDKVNVKRA